MSAVWGRHVPGWRLQSYHPNNWWRFIATEGLRTLSRGKGRRVHQDFYAAKLSPSPSNEEFWYALNLCTPANQEAGEALFGIGRLSSTTCAVRWL